MSKDNSLTITNRERNRIILGIANAEAIIRAIRESASLSDAEHLRLGLAIHKLVDARYGLADEKMVDQEESDLGDTLYDAEGNKKAEIWDA